jgi:hypothetical protein
MRHFTNILLIILGIIIMSCSSEMKQEDNFKYITEQFADLRIQRYQVPGFDDLNLQQKLLSYYLYQAALSGRDIIYDQNYKHNLCIRRTLEAIVNISHIQSAYGFQMVYIIIMVIKNFFRNFQPNILKNW